MFNNYLTLDSHGFLLLNMKRYREAIVYFNKAIALEGIRYPRMLGWMGAAYAKSGKRHKALEIIDQLKERLARNEKGSIAFFIAVIYSAMNEKGSALSWLKVAYDSHDMEMPWLMTEPQFYNLHGELEFQQLARQMGFKKGFGNVRNFFLPAHFDTASISHRFIDLFNMLLSLKKKFKVFATQVEFGSFSCPASLLY